MSFYESNMTDVPHLDARLRRVRDLVLASGATRVLDVACGRGALLEAIRAERPGMALTGCDISEAALAHTRSLGFDVALADVTRGLPFADESFDLVVFGEVIEHVVDPDAALQHLSRVLTRGGRLIVTTPNLAAWFNRALLLAGVQPLFTETSSHVNLGRRTPGLGQWKSTVGHLKIFTLAAMREMLAANGFAVELETGAPHPQPTRLAKLDEFLARFPSLAACMVVSATNGRTLRTDYPRLAGWLETVSREVPLGA